MWTMKNVLMNEETGGEGTPPAGGTPPTEGNWYDDFSEDIRSNQNVTKFESAEVMAKSWINAQHMIGADKIAMPQTDEDWSGVYSRLGRPDEANMYQIDAPEGVEVNQEMQDAFKGIAHELGLSQKQAEGLASWQFANEATQGQAFKDAAETAHNNATDSLKSEWGEAFEQNTALAARAASEFMGDAGKEFFDNAKIDGVPAGDHPALLKMFHSVAKGMMESSKLEGIANEGKQTPQEIQDNINSLMSHPAYMDNKHPEHQTIARKVRAAFELQAG